MASGSGRGSWKVGRTDRHDADRAAEELARLQEHIKQHQEDTRAFEAAREAAERSAQPLLVEPPVPLSADIGFLACVATLDDCAYNAAHFASRAPAWDERAMQNRHFYGSEQEAWQQNLAPPSNRNRRNRKKSAQNFATPPAQAPLQKDPVENNQAPHGQVRDPNH